MMLSSRLAMVCLLFYYQLYPIIAVILNSVFGTQTYDDDEGSEDPNLYMSDAVLMADSQATLLVEITERRGLPANHRLYRTREGLENYAKGFDRVLTAVQRAIARFGNPKAPDSLSIEIDKAKSLRAISETLTGILDTMRYQVCSLMLRLRLHIVAYSFYMLIRIEG